ncbi:MAG: hypothetical protein LBL79_06165 [Prevotella sp.]|jgi:hypothetical protein|nr:hypothetical protein [Prevotella sp.]
MSKLKQLLAIIPEPLRDCYFNYKYNKQLKNWEKNGRPLPTPHIVKQLAIKSYQKKYNVDTLIETGTYLGDMVYAQRKLFKKIYTIELSKELFKRCRKRLNKYKHIEVIQGDSGVILESLVRELNQKALFWLDGHYSGGVTAKGDKESPVIQELKTILQSNIEHIILIDDARNFDGTNDYPTVEQLKALILEGGYPDSTIKVEDDIIRVELKS